MDFSPYRPKSDTNLHSGSGLGIPICEMIAKLHGGTFDIRSGAQGATITKIHLPISTQNKNAHDEHNLASFDRRRKTNS